MSTTREESARTDPLEDCCPDGACLPSGPNGLNRRRFLTLGASLAGLALLADRRSVAHALGVAEDDVFVVPADKRIPAEWMRTLYARGVPTTYQGSDLRLIGMPVGGGCAGQVYLGGDGRLWHWDIFNLPGGGTSDQAYLNPHEPSSPFAIGFALRTDGRTRSLDSAGFEDVRFTGQYPIGRVAYRSAGSPVEVTLEAFSPFVPLETDDSTMPATVLAYTVRNTSGRPVEAELFGWAENPVCLESRSRQPISLHSAAFGSKQTAGLEFSASEGEGAGDPVRPDIVFEDWERDTYEGWTVEGTAFGTGPVRESDIPAYMKGAGDLHVTGVRFVTSHAYWEGDIGAADRLVGRLVSQPFTIERKYLRTRIGGGGWAETAMRVLVDGAVVASASGSDAEPMDNVRLDLSEWQGRTATIEIVDGQSGGWGHVNVDDIRFTDGPAKPDIVFEDWERDTYAGWTVEGTAFGSGPVRESDVPDYMTRFGDLKVTGTRFVTSHAFWDGDIPNADAPVGRLISRPFTIERRYIQTRVGGGSTGGTAVRVVVDGVVVGSASGAAVEPMDVAAVDVTRWMGRTATIEVLDAESGGWGHVNVDDIVFTDVAPDPRPLSELTDLGTFALAALDPNARVRPSIAGWSTPEEAAGSEPAPEVVDASLADQAGTVGVTVRLAPGEERTVRFAVGWSFPLPDRQWLGFLRGSGELLHHYSTRFASARDVVRTIGAEPDRLEGKTRLWAKTFYEDSTLPHWFLERTLLNASTLATTVCHRFHDGRFYGWEGTYCCAGTCQHVWNYAQALARLFPALERDTRERVDLDIGYNPQTGQTGFRAEADMNWAADGQAGTILRVFREHLTSTDDEFVVRNWPRIKQATEFLIGHDRGTDGTLDGLQHNTLDANWFGEIAWISSMYVAALYAAAEMATLAGDAAFARRCRRLGDSGAEVLETKLWNGETFVQKIDPEHADIVNHNVGSHIDQMFGQSLVAQIGGRLPRVMAQDKCRTALDGVYRYNFTPDAAGWRAINTAFAGGRWFAMEGEHGVIMTTWPNGGAEAAPGKPASWSAIYFNECWSGQEYQLAAHMLAEGLVEQGLLVTRAVHERYRPGKRNPYNEIECSEHYARAMASYGVFTTMCGFEFDGPRGHIGFAPAMGEDDFAAAFTAAEGWGLYRQQRRGSTHRSWLEVRHGRLALESLALGVRSRPRVTTVWIDGRPVEHTLTARDDGRVEIVLGGRALVAEGQTVEVFMRGGHPHG